MRILLLALLALTVATAAEAQTTPAKKPAAKTKTAARRVARRPARRPAPVAAQNTNIAPPPEAPASAGGQGAYAAPGMPINPSSGKNVGDYNSANSKERNMEQ